MDSKEVKKILESYNTPYLTIDVALSEEPFLRLKEKIKADEYFNNEFGKLSNSNEQGIFATKDGEETLILKNLKNNDSTDIPFIYFWVNFQDGTIEFHYQDRNDIDLSSIDPNDTKQFKKIMFKRKI